MTQKTNLSLDYFVRLMKLIKEHTEELPDSQGDSFSILKENPKKFYRRVGPETGNFRSVDVETVDIYTHMTWTELRHQRHIQEAFGFRKSFVNYNLPKHSLLIHVRLVAVRASVPVLEIINYKVDDPKLCSLDETPEEQRHYDLRVGIGVINFDSRLYKAARHGEICLRSYLKKVSDLEGFYSNIEKILTLFKSSCEDAVEHAKIQECAE